MSAQKEKWGKREERNELENRQIRDDYFGGCG